MRRKNLFIAQLLISDSVERLPPYLICFGNTFSCRSIKLSFSHLRICVLQTAKLAPLHAKKNGKVFNGSTFHYNGWVFFWKENLFDLEPSSVPTSLFFQLLPFHFHRFSMAQISIRGIFFYFHSLLHANILQGRILCNHNITVFFLSFSPCVIWYFDSLSTVDSVQPKKISKANEHFLFLLISWTDKNRIFLVLDLFIFLPNSFN